MGCSVVVLSNKVLWLYDCSYKKWKLKIYLNFKSTVVQYTWFAIKRRETIERKQIRNILLIILCSLDLVFCTQSWLKRVLLLYFPYFYFFCALIRFLTGNWFLGGILERCQLEKKTKTLNIILWIFENFPSSHLFYNFQSRQPPVKTALLWRFKSWRLSRFFQATCDICLES